MSVDKDPMHGRAGVSWLLWLFIGLVGVELVSRYQRGKRLAERLRLNWPTTCEDDNQAVAYEHRCGKSFGMRGPWTEAEHDALVASVKRHVWHCFSTKRADRAAGLGGQP